MINKSTENTSLPRFPNPPRPHEPDNPPSQESTKRPHLLIAVSPSEKGGAPVRARLNVIELNNMTPNMTSLGDEMALN